MLDAAAAPSGGRPSLRRTVDVLYALTSADVRVRYGRDPIRVLRWLLDPFAAAGVYLMLVAFVLNRPGSAPGLSIACAIVPFQLVMVASINGLASVQSRRTIIANMRFERSFIPFASTVSDATGFLAALSLIAVMMAVYGVAPTWAVLWLPVLVVLTLLYAVAISYPAALLGLWYPQFRPFAVSAVRAAFFLAPGMVALNQIHGQAARWIKLNPLTGIFEAFRAVFLYGHSPALWMLLYPGGDGARPPGALRPALHAGAGPVREAARMTDVSVEASGLGVRFQFDRHRRGVISPTIAWTHRRGPAVWGLRGVDVRIGAGEGVALVGSIGSGKTSLLRTIAGILPADEGSVTVHGRIGTLLSTQAGLLSLLTGRENTLLLGVLNGLTRRETQAAVEEIKERTKLGDAFELPVATYSEGMCARLGFAVATYRQVDVLLLDEVHESLDHEFRHVVAEHADGIRARGGIVVAAGHDHGALEAICDRAILLAGGHIVGDGAFHTVVDDYLAV